MTWRRASTKEQKEQRKVTIYLAAYELFLEMGYERTSLNGIAARAGFTKSNVYRYYASKDEVFLDIFMDLFDRWLTSLMDKMSGLEPQPTARLFAETIMSTKQGHESFYSLTPYLFTSLEANSSTDQLVHFKTFTREKFFAFFQSLNRLYPELTIMDAKDCMRMLNALVSTFWVASHYNPVLADIYRREEFQPLRPDYDQDMCNAIEVVILGLLAKRRGA